MDRFIVGFKGSNGSIDPIVGMVVSEDGMEITLTSYISTFFGVTIDQTEPTSLFLKNNKSFYVYDNILKIYIGE